MGLQPHSPILSAAYDDAQFTLKLLKQSRAINLPLHNLPLKDNFNIGTVTTCDGLQIIQVVAESGIIASASMQAVKPVNNDMMKHKIKNGNLHEEKWIGEAIVASHEEMHY